MSITYSWGIDSLHKKNIYTLSDVVYKISWYRQGVDIDGYSSSYGGTLDLIVPETIEEVNSITGFTTYSSLTESNIISWLNDEYDTTNIDAEIQSNITLNKHLVLPTVFPWNN
tara:strand:+ start:455 stop:793 length:339 start_codon:yes stop_codon:yes gene_type:complete